MHWKKHFPSIFVLYRPSWPPPTANDMAGGQNIAQSKKALMCPRAYFRE
jgi:hypothetical protein